MSRLSVSLILGAFWVSCPFLGFAQLWDYPLGIYDINKTPIDYGSPEDLIVSGDKAYFFLDNPETNDDELYAFDGDSLKYFGEYDGYTSLVSAFDHGCLFNFSDFSERKLFYIDNSTLTLNEIADIRAEGGHRLNNLYIFQYNNRLYSTDGTDSGTLELESFFSLDNDWLLVNGEYLLFEANDGLWRTDGTVSGTFELVEIASFFSLDELVTTDSIVVFEQDLNFQPHLFRTDGTQAGTYPIVELPNDIFEIGKTEHGIVFTLNQQGTTGFELWVSDGTETGTFMLPEINPGPESGVDIQGLFHWQSDGAHVFFKGGDNAGHTQLWRSDGTALGTMPVIDFDTIANYGDSWHIGSAVRLPSGKSLLTLEWGLAEYTIWGFNAEGNVIEPLCDSRYYVTEFNSQMNSLGIFLSAGVDEEEGLWFSDGTPAGTTLLRAYDDVDQMYLFEDHLFYIAEEENGSWYGDLHFSDGTPEGTGLVRAFEDSPGAFFNINGIFHHTVPTAEIGEAIVTSDGTFAGTEVLLDLYPNTQGSDLKNLTYLPGKVLFTSFGVSNLRVLDEETGEVTDFGLTVDGDFYKGRIGDKLLFNTTNDKLYATDGTLGGTVLLLDDFVWWEDYSSYLFAELDDKLFFLFQSGLWQSDGTPDGTEEVLSFEGEETPTLFEDNYRLVSNGSYLFFEAVDELHGKEFWRTDGTVAGTQLVKDFTPGVASSDIRWTATLQQDLMIVVSSFPSGEATLWKTDGTEAGSVLIGEFNGINAEVVGDQCFFASYQGLWVLNAGASEPVELVSGGSFTSVLSPFPPGILFSYNDGSNGFEPWITDGTPGGTRLVKDLNPGSSSFSPLNFHAVFDQALFSGNAFNSQLWVTNGNPLFTDAIIQGSYGDIEDVKEIIRGGSRIYVVGKDKTFGNELLYIELEKDTWATGTAFHDENENGLRDTTEAGIPDLPIRIEQIPNYTTYTGEDGQFQVFTGRGQATTVLPDDDQCWERITTPESYDVQALDTLITGLDFGFRKLAGPVDFMAEIQSGPTRCGFTVPFWLNGINQGCEGLSAGQLSVDLGDLLTLVEYDTAATDVSGTTLSWSFDTLAVGQQLQQSVMLEMPDENFVGDTIILNAILFLEEAEGLTPVDTFEYRSVLTCAIDPNDKLVRPARAEPSNSNYTQFEETLHYTVRFQNTGTDTAFTVRIVDQLSEDLDWNTLNVLSASHHPFRTNLSENGRLEFIFENILLPDSTTNEPESHGYVSFQINANEGLEDFTAIENTAHIYFDFNEAIVTNTVQNTMVEYLDFDQDGFPFWEDCMDDDPDINPDAEEIPGNDIDENCDGSLGPVGTTEAAQLPLTLQPNPTYDQITVIWPGMDTYEIQLTDMLGQSLVTPQQVSGAQTTLSLSSLPAGVYLIRVVGANGAQTASQLVVKK